LTLLFDVQLATSISLTDVPLRIDRTTAIVTTAATVHPVIGGENWFMWKVIRKRKQVNKYILIQRLLPSGSPLSGSPGLSIDSDLPLIVIHSVPDPWETINLINYVALTWQCRGCYKENVISVGYFIVCNLYLYNCVL